MACANLILMQEIKNKVDDKEGPIWKQPYFLYLALTAVLFAFLLILAWLGWKSGWIATSS